MYLDIATALAVVLVSTKLLLVESRAHCNLNELGAEFEVDKFNP